MIQKFWKKVGGRPKESKNENQIIANNFNILRELALHEMAI